MEGIKFYKRPRLRNPYLIVAWPGMGEVAFKAAAYLVDKLKAEDLAEIPGKEFFYLAESIIKDGILSLPQAPTNKFYYWKNKTGKNDLIIFVSEAQADLAKAEEYCQKILYVAKKFRVKSIISFAAMPQAVDHGHTPAVWFAATSVGLNNELKKYNLSQLSEGQISGLNGLFLGIAKREGLDGFCLLGEISLYTIQIENPKAAYAVLEAFSRIMNIKIDFSDIIEQARVIEEEINKLLDYLKLGPSPGPIGEEEIEKIKKSLNQLTKLPLSVKEKIDNLFLEAKKDLSKAQALKIELDKWNVYKEYEDRFLDLFKKGKDKNN